MPSQQFYCGLLENDKFMIFQRQCKQIFSLNLFRREFGYFLLTELIEIVDMKTQIDHVQLFPTPKKEFSIDKTVMRNFKTILLGFTLDTHDISLNNICTLLN